MKRFLFLVLIGIGFSASAQDLTGIWRGSFKSENARYLEALGEDSRYKIELQVDQTNKAFSGVTYSYLTTVFYGKATCRGTVNPNTKKVFLEELKIVEVRMSGQSSACVMTYFLQYSKIGDEEFLEGSYTSVNNRDSSSCGRGTVFLRKVVTSDFYKEPFLVKKEAQKAATATKPAPAPANPTTGTAKTTTPLAKNPTANPKPGTGNKTTTPAKPGTPNKTNTAKTNTPQKPVTPPPPAKTPDPKPVVVDTKPVEPPKKIEVKPVIVTPKVLATRDNELVKTITTGARKITVNIYDNGAIDNDTISVYLDKKLVLSKKRLTDRALSIEFELNEDDAVHELVMVAENLGEIPPNTSLMVVNAGGKYYEVRITSTEQKNAVVVFKFDKTKP
ncbi:hypothetical protein HHL16_22905 [Pseudoflavitalea sp. G-6-1-2]|uniref:hypothetical protein n=1 Tax=Pseudoflavitalea sp. G-6-1-2 TaxID=2728841 RepID=UPI00146A86ED|nr:hypothetical protein [Pseudoflavitalea sp. G-6-1-2]NML23749.1 hypothetical protein [Pseudoflavitalea sp. G-6-1-2]